ncbi:MULTISPECIES: hypothetical protein [Bacillus]|uniref:hypothetical protein n=1 Tax=Bacillus TaxID=1386 RepID=UPI0023DF8119|nr:MULTISPECIES: hypothetical protein [Bacillus]MDF3254982.1 hypothetical protein [Bacillus velezensis]MDF3267789.1 hypothetical protein [Bacillus velezensis]
MFKKSLLGISALALSVTTLLPVAQVSAQEKATKETSFHLELQKTQLQQAVEAKQDVTQNAPIHAQGIKTKAIRIVIDKLRNGIGEVIDVLKWAHILDGNTARSFKKHANFIADKLEGWLDIPNEIIGKVKEELPGLLIKRGVSKGVAHTIATAVGYLLKGAEWLFL